MFGCEGSYTASRNNITISRCGSFHADIASCCRMTDRWAGFSPFIRASVMLAMVVHNCALSRIRLRMRCHEWREESSRSCRKTF